MTYELYIAFVGFMFASSLTPGPNNLMVMASGANFGHRRTLPHQLGIATGFAFMVVLMGVGISAVFERFPWLNTVLMVVATAYLFWLAWKIAHAAAPGSGPAKAKPMTFLQAAAFQWVNPKAWAMALSAVTIYLPDNATVTLLIVAGSYFVVTMISTSVWTRLGQEVRRVLTNPRRLTFFNWTMAVLLIASLMPVLLA